MKAIVQDTYGSAGRVHLVARQQRAAVLQDREPLGDSCEPGVDRTVAPGFDRRGSDPGAQPFDFIDLTPDRSQGSLPLAQRQAAGDHEVSGDQHRVRAKLGGRLLQPVTGEAGLS